MPELAAEGSLDLEGALVLDGVGDVAALRAAFEAGTPVVVRAGSAEEIRDALARPEVASVVVPADRDDLLSLDLTELTYG